MWAVGRIVRLDSLSPVEVATSLIARQLNVELNVFMEEISEIYPQLSQSAAVTSAKLEKVSL
jgi:hypothetical protein